MKLIPNTYKKYGYKMFNCSLSDLFEYIKHCYDVKKVSDPTQEFGFLIFNNVNEAIQKINFKHIPAEHGKLPQIKHSLTESNQLLIREITFYKAEDQQLYQNSIEKAWALEGHLDPRVQQFYYD